MYSLSSLYTTEQLLYHCAVVMDRLLCLLLLSLVIQGKRTQSMNLEMVFENINFSSKKVCLVANGKGQVDDQALHQGVQLSQGYAYINLLDNALDTLVDCEHLIALDDARPDDHGLEGLVTFSKTKDVFVLASDEVQMEQILAQLKLMPELPDLSSNFYIILLSLEHMDHHLVLHEAYDVYHTGLRSNLVCFSDIGTEICDPDEGKLERRKDLSGVHLRAVIEFYPPLAMYNKLDLSEKPTGMVPDVFHEFQRIMNFTYDLRKSVDGKWGGLLEDGFSFDGMVGMLQRQEVDVCIGSLDILESRSRVVDYTGAVVSDNAKIFIKSPSNARLNFYEMFLIFNKEVWQLMALLLLVTSVACFLHFRAELITRPIISDLSHAGALPMRAVILKGHTRLPGRVGGKIIVLSILFFGIMIFALYRGGVLSKLAVKKFRTPINSIDDILDSDFKLGTVDGTNTEFYFSKAPLGTTRSQLWSMVRQNLVSTIGDGIKLLLSDDSFAFFMYSSAGITSPHYPCSVIDVGNPYMRVNEALAFQKGSALRQIFDFHLVKMRENGLLRKMRDKWKKAGKADQSICSSSSLDLDLGYEELMGIFMILVSGIVFSGVFYLIELALVKALGRPRPWPGRRRRRVMTKLVDNLEEIMDVVDSQIDTSLVSDLETLQRLVSKLKKHL